MLYYTETVTVGSFIYCEKSYTKEILTKLALTSYQSLNYRVLTSMTI